MFTFLLTTCLCTPGQPPAMPKAPVVPLPTQPVAPKTGVPGYLSPPPPAPAVPAPGPAKAFCVLNRHQQTTLMLAFADRYLGRIPEGVPKEVIDLRERIETALKVADKLKPLAPEAELDILTLYCVGWKSSVRAGVVIRPTVVLNQAGERMLKAIGDRIGADKAKAISETVDRIDGRITQTGEVQLIEQYLLLVHGRKLP